MIRPRITMRRILDAGRDRAIIPLIVLASISAALGDVDRSSLAALERIPGPTSLIVIGICLGLALFFLLLFYVFAWIGFGVSRLLEGTATAREVRSALAWGVVPVIWSILYRLPAILLWPGTMESRVRAGSNQLSFQPQVFSHGCIGTVIFVALELTMLVWYAVVTSSTLAEANRFSTGRGFATLVLTAISPAVIVIAAILAS